MTNLNTIVLVLTIMPDPNAIGCDCGTTLNSIRSYGNARPNNIGFGNLAMSNILVSCSQARSNNFESSCGAGSNSIGFEIVLQNIFFKSIFYLKIIQIIYFLTPPQN